MFCSRTIVLLLAFMVATLTPQAQTLPDFDLLAKLKLLQSDRSSVEKLLSEGAFSVWNQSNRQTYFRYFENIQVDYSTGKCSDVHVDEPDWFLGPDVWNVSEGNVVRITFEPKGQINLRNLGIDVTKFKKERLFRNYSNYYIYFNKTTGIAITAWDELVESIELFPTKDQHNELCDDATVLKHFSSNKWRFQPEKPKIICILPNKPANVHDVSILERSEENKFEIVVTADDPENDVLTFIYFVTAGQITSKGAKATWDLTGAKQGSYEIKIAADDGVGPRGRWISRVVTIN